MDVLSPPSVTGSKRAGDFLVAECIPKIAELRTPFFWKALNILWVKTIWVLGSVLVNQYTVYSGGVSRGMV